MGNVQDARREMTKTKEQLEEEKKISLSIRIKPLDLDGMDSDQLRLKANELWDTIVRLETEKYDLEERQKRQDYDVSSQKCAVLGAKCSYTCSIYKQQFKLDINVVMIKRNMGTFGPLLQMDRSLFKLIMSFNTYFEL